MRHCALWTRYARRLNMLSASVASLVGGSSTVDERGRGSEVVLMSDDGDGPNHRNGRPSPDDYRKDHGSFAGRAAHEGLSLEDTVPCKSCREWGLKLLVALGASSLTNHGDRATLTATELRRPPWLPLPQRCATRPPACLVLSPIEPVLLGRGPGCTHVAASIVQRKKNDGNWHLDTFARSAWYRAVPVVTASGIKRPHHRNNAIVIMPFQGVKCILGNWGRRFHVDPDAGELQAINGLPRVVIIIAVGFMCGPRYG